MNERFTTVVGALIIAGLAFCGGLFVHSSLVRSNVNPVGFHVDGRAFVTGNQGFDLSKCPKNSTCMITFDFSSDVPGGDLQTMSCPAQSKCWSFTNVNGDTLNVSTHPNPAHPSKDEVYGMLQVVSQ
ncbi:MAG: hypothetical protein WAL67_04860 [Candidatus Cybelea sp.]